MVFSISNTSLATSVLCCTYTIVNKSVSGVIIGWSDLLALEFPKISENLWGIPVGVVYLCAREKKKRAREELVDGLSDNSYGCTT